MTSRFEIVTRILRNLGLESYLESFKKNLVDDEVLEFLNENEIDHLKDVIPVLGDRIKFFKELKKSRNESILQQSTMSMSQVSICDEPDEPKSTYPPKELTIIEMKGDSLSINLNNLSEILDQIGLKKTILLTIAGDSPQEKSFILTNIYKYFEQVENSNGNSIDFEPSEPDENVQTNPSNCLTMYSKSIRLQNAVKEDIQVIVMDLKSNEVDDKNEVKILEKLILNISTCFVFLTENPDITNYRLSKYLTAFPLHKYFCQKFITIGQSQKNSGLKVNFFAQNCDAFFLPIIEEPWKKLPSKYLNELHNCLFGGIANLKNFNQNGYQIKEIIEKCVSNYNLSNPFLMDDFKETLKSLGISNEDHEGSLNLNLNESNELKKRVGDSVKLCISSFEQNLKSQLEKFLFVPSNYFDSEGFTNVQSIFAEFVQPFDEELFKICEPQISLKIQEIVARFKIDNEKSRQMYTEELQKILENLFKNYSEQMDQFTKKTMYEPEDLQTAQTSIKHRTLDEFSKHEIFRNLLPITCENYRHELDLKINNHFTKNSKSYLDKQKIIGERLKRTLEQCKTFYEDQMKRTLNDNFWSDEKFDILHENCSKEANARFVEKLSDILLEIPPEYFEKLDEKMKKKLIKLKGENNQMKLNAQHKAEKSVSCEARNYEEKMNQYCSKSYLKNRELANLHEKEMEKCLENFKNGFPKSLSIQEYEADLIERVRKTYETISDLNFLRREDEEAFKNKVDKYVKLYSTEMENYFANKTFHKREDLQIAHRNVRGKMSKNFAEEYSFEKDKLDGLDKALDLKFKYFEDLNLMNQPKNPAVGIDLGTTYSCIGIFHNNRIKIIENKIGKETTPSYVQFSAGGRVTVGEPAKASSYLSPESTIYDSKRLIGKNFFDPKIQNYFKNWPFQVIRGAGDTPLISVMEIHKEFRPEEISSLILKELKELAINFLGLEEDHVLDAVITVPYYFTDRQRLATKDAGTLSGLNVLRIINEPTAASIAYRLEYVHDETILVYDLGGGTFDVSLLTIRNGNIDVDASGGDTNLGGQDFDNKLIDYCLDQFKEKTGVDIDQEMKSPDLGLKGQAKSCMSRLRAECERRKCELSQTDKTWIDLPKVFQHHDMRVEITRDIFENINEDLFQKTINIVENVLNDARFGKEDVNEIVLVGGSTRIPKIQSLLQNCFDGRQLKFSHRPDHVVAEGAAILAAQINGGGGDKGTKLAEFKVNDVTPHSLGISVNHDGSFSKIIRKNTRVPVSLTEEYTTITDNQVTMRISIYEGENPKTKDNNHLGKFNIENIPPAPQGHEKVYVTMKIDEEGILNVTATNRGNSKDITLKEYRNRITRPEDK